MTDFIAFWNWLLPPFTPCWVVFRHGTCVMLREGMPPEAALSRLQAAGNEGQVVGEFWIAPPVLNLNDRRDARALDQAQPEIVHVGRSVDLATARRLLSLVTKQARQSFASQVIIDPAVGVQLLVGEQVTTAMQPPADLMSNWLRSLRDHPEEFGSISWEGDRATLRIRS